LRHPREAGEERWRRECGGNVVLLDLALELAATLEITHAVFERDGALVLARLERVEIISIVSSRCVIHVRVTVGALACRHLDIVRAMERRLPAGRSAGFQPAFLTAAP
jgi:hypothetical protein